MKILPNLTLKNTIYLLILTLFGSVVSLSGTETSIIFSILALIFNVAFVALLLMLPFIIYRQRKAKKAQ